MRKVMPILMLVFVAGVLLSCGGTDAADCGNLAIRIDPQNGTADHLAAAPGNQQRFMAWGEGGIPGCVYLMSNLMNVTWSTSDAVNTSIDAQGVATCNNATSAPVTITGSAPAGVKSKVLTATATLTCR